MEFYCFTFGPFQENTFVLYDNTKECVIIDPGCYSQTEQNELKTFIQNHELKPVRLLNTHCHIDHIAGNRFVFDTYGLKPEIHELDLIILENQEITSKMYNIPCDPSPKPEKFLTEGMDLTFGETRLEVIFTPGHAPGHVVFYHKASKQLFNGDVLFRGSIGRTDFPLCNHADLISSIKNKLFHLPEDVIVYCGHGPETTIEFERLNNPFLT